jgi:N6-adenosine-specific RNA methylase IME4
VRADALEAERKMGEMLAATERAKGAMGIGKSAVTSSDRTPTLAELNISKRESVEAQMLAKVPRREFERVKSGEKTKVQIRRDFKELAREAKRADNFEKIKNAPDIKGVNGLFSTIVIDPPWDWGDEGDVDQLGRARPDYHTMSVDQIAALPVGRLAADDAHLYLWITNRSLPKGFGLIEKWGFRYITCLTWCKPSIGMGNYFRGSTEQILFGVKGSMPLKRKDAGTWFGAKRPGRHSAKPPEFIGLVESCSPGPYLEMFGRTERPGWKIWGEEA